MKNVNITLNNMRNSKNRDMVVDILTKASMPLSVEDIFYRIKKDNDKNKLSLSTIYRIIVKLCDLNIVRKAAMDDNKALYELVRINGHHHHYLICTKCKKMIELDSCPMAELEKNIEDETGFKITGHTYEIYGECVNCRKNADSL